MERFNFDFPPFEYLDRHGCDAVQRAADIVFFQDGETVVRAQEAVERLYVVIKGLVKEVGADGEILALYRTNDAFDARALMEGTAAHDFVVEEQALVYALPKVVVREVMESNPRFSAFFYTSIAEKLSNLPAEPQQELSNLFTAKVRDAYRAQTVWLDGQSTILQAAETMRQHKSKSVLVRHEGRIGLFTESVFRDIVAAGVSGSASIAEWTRFELIAVDIDDFVFTALLRMTEFNIQRVVVEEHGVPVGTLEQIDMLAYFSNHSHWVVQRLDAAETLDDLADAAHQITASVRVLRSNGVRAPQLAQLVQVLNDGLFRKLWRLIAPSEVYEASCLIVMGSEGRGEQILKTDQDNALIVRDGVEMAAVHEAAARFSAALASFGFPPCKGKIMVNNPAWCRNLSDFRRTVGAWCTAPDADGLMNLAIFMDAQAVAGDTQLLDELKGYLYRVLNDDVGMMMAFARAVEQFDHHSKGFFAQLLNRGQAEKMDLKKMGIFPIVHGIRALSLQAHIRETNTFDRIKVLSERGLIDAQMGRDVAEALAFLMELRLRAGLAFCDAEDREECNRIDTAALSTLERDLLKEALHVVKRFKGIIRFHFHLNA